MIRTNYLVWLDRIPLGLLFAGALLLGLSPFLPAPHLWEKLQMLVAGTLSRPVDVLDLLMHASLPVLLGFKLVRLIIIRNQSSSSPGSSHGSSEP